MHLVFDQLFTKKELSKKTRWLFHRFAEDCSSFGVQFEETFGISYALVFGKMDYSDAMLVLLQKYYQNEFFVKQMFSKKCLDGCEISNEIVVDDRRADIVCCRGNTTECYEIKTQYDDFARIQKQIEAYSACFEKVSVVCSEDKAERVLSLVPNYCGVISYKNRSNCAFTTIRSASASPVLDSNAIVRCLHVDELKTAFGTSNRDSIAELNPKDNLSLVFASCLKKRFSHIPR